MIFSNYKNVATSEAREKLLKLIDASVGCVRPKQFVPKAMKLHTDRLLINKEEFSIKDKRIFVIGAGKASAEMALEVEKILGSRRITNGIIISNKTVVRLKKISVCLADHPIPSARGLHAVEKMFDLKNKYNINKNDLVIVLVSGGGSALMPYPVSSVSLADKKKLYGLFIKYGVAGFESTIIKAKISRVKGGGLARHFFPARMISLVLSDDNGQAGDEFTASGPCTAHCLTFADALRVIDKYRMRKEAPKSIIAYLEKNREEDKKKSSVKNVQQFILASNKILLTEIDKLAKKEGCTVSVQSGVAGETREVAWAFCERIKKINKKQHQMLVYGGETTVSLSKKHGLGGRNQEFIVACLKYLQNVKMSKQWALVSLATDGTDFIKQSAGGIIDRGSLNFIKNKNIDIDKFLSKHDSHNLLKAIKANLFISEPTGTNVGDLMMYLQL